MTTDLQQRAEQVMPGGVNSPVRAFRSVGGSPIYAKQASGAELETTDGRRLIDYCMSFGPLILGHAHPSVVEAVQEAVARGASYAVTTEAEIEMAELIRAAIPSMERVRLVSSGTEACMTAIRVARGFTGREKVLKFSGCYHGHVDCMLVKAGSGVAGIASASSAGVPVGCAGNTLVARYNHLEDVDALLDEHGADLAGIVVEPVAANVGLILPEPGFLEGLRMRADRVGALLIFDEVINGFRFGFGGYQNQCGVSPDVTCLGKIIGGGMPVGAVGGRADVMERLAPLGDVYQAGTLSGNPVSVAAGLATLRTLRELAPYAALERATAHLVSAIQIAASRRGIPVVIPTLGSVFSVFFGETAVRDFDDVMRTDKDRYVRVFHALLRHGVYMPPSPFEVSFLSVAHSEAHVQKTVAAWEAALEDLVS
ncbi:MAG TPA: glutamate-1-semialdehyde 2,1-aminomutase [Kiritimatiellia bacterium]|nr:glutamate-1-semialdehyde 2,1-aminomutase [Kiritimatiellia bacterium]HMO97537.1 glutamate-1-semialdehyde 2,1-aminomutase [Kiritimatiellia bacterium]HMP97025.1 glutamate-1-semialdehyde 2,1-aminomutase [Kiritimatiellia bacterium]